MVKLWLKYKKRLHKGQNIGHFLLSPYYNFPILHCAFCTPFPSSESTHSPSMCSPPNIIFYKTGVMEEQENKAECRKWWRQRATTGTHLNTRATVFPIALRYLKYPRQVNYWGGFCVDGSLTHMLPPVQKKKERRRFFPHLAQDKNPPPP